jgi:nucleoside 2-deoxyribosyltransferase
VKVYLAGPMRGYESFNFPAFRAAATELRAKGYEVASPAERAEETGGFDPSLNSEESVDLRAAFRWDVAQVLASDAVVVLPGWQVSKGASVEVSLAEVVGIPVIPLNRALASPE